MDHGKQAEINLKSILNQIAGEDFVFQSPEVIEQFGKKLELTDFLVLLNDTLITIQSKSIDINIEDLNEIKLGRIVKKIEDAKGQLNRTFNALKRSDRVTLESKNIPNELELPWDIFKKHIGIITLNIDDNLFKDPEFRFQIPKFEKYKNYDLHIFLLQDLTHFTNELKTAGDLLHYLICRKAMINYIEQILTNELDLLAIYKSKYNIIEEMLANKYSHVAMLPGLWEEYIQEKQKEIKNRDQKLSKSKIIDVIIKHYRHSIDYTINNYNYDKKQALIGYFKTVGLLGSLTSVEKYYVENHLTEKLKLSRTNKFHYFLYPRETVGYLFLITNEENREERLSQLQFFCEQAALSLHKNFPDIKTVFGIATEGLQLPYRSFDSAIFEIADVIDDLKEFEYPIFEIKNEGIFNEWNI